MRVGVGELAHSNLGDLRGRNAQRHFFLEEGDDEEFKLETGNLLLFDRDDLAKPMGRINDELTRLEAQTLLTRLFRAHSCMSSRFNRTTAPEPGTTSELAEKKTLRDGTCVIDVRITPSQIRYSSQVKGQKQLPLRTGRPTYL